MYRPISLVNKTYKVLARILQKRLEELVEEMVTEDLQEARKEALLNREGFNVTGARE